MDKLGSAKIEQLKNTPEYARFEEVLKKIVSYTPEKKTPKSAKA